MENKLTYDLKNDLKSSRWLILFIIAVSLFISILGVVSGVLADEGSWSIWELSHLMAALFSYVLYRRMVHIKRYPTIYAALSFLSLGLATYTSGLDDVKGIWFSGGSISYIIIYGALVKLFDIDNPDQAVEQKKEKKNPYSFFRNFTSMLSPNSDRIATDGKMVLKIEMEEIQEWSTRLMVVVLLTGLLPFLMIWGYSDSVAVLGNIHESFFLWAGTYLLYIFLFILALAVGSLIHELIHALAFLPFLQSGLNALKFGYLKEKLALYVHIKEPISVTGFRIGVVMPAVILGVFPMVLGLLYGYLSVLLFGIFMTVAAVGDVLLLAKTVHLHSGYMITDQPDDIAVVAVENSNPGQLVS